MPGAEGGGIFVSYRRQESKHFAGRLYDRLADQFGKGQIFIDVDTIELGVDFAEAISRAVAACQVLLAVIGPTWLTITDEQGRRRLDDPDDIVRLEVEAALARDVRVIPILVEGARMPRRDDLPESLAGLARRNALLIRHENFRDDAGRLVTAIERVLAAVPGAAALPGASDAPGAMGAAHAVGELAHQEPGTRSNDPGRAARLFTDAVYIAHTITDEYWKAVALSSIAEALAATDPDRAARLFTDAERITLSITNEFTKLDALSDIVKAVAATDPDRAETIAHTITSHIRPDLPFKALALSSIATAVTATDPGRAARLLADAERIAQTTPDTFWKAMALAATVEALAATDSGRAELSPIPSPTSARRPRC